MTDKFLSRLRVLPTLIGLASVLFTVKVASVWIGAQDAIAPAFVVSDASAAEPRQDQAAPTESADGPPAAEPAADHEAQAGDADGEDEAGTPSAQDGRAPVAGPPPSRQADAGSPGLSDAELKVLQQLTDRRKELEAREREMAERSALLDAAEARIDQKIEDLKGLQATLEKLTKLREEQEEMELASLVKIYETMKPKDAARIFEELEMETLLLVADRMKERKLAPIMAEMDPAKAKDVTVELARLRKLPQQPAAQG